MRELSTPSVPVTSGPIVELANVSKSYRRGSETVMAVRGASLSLVPGSVTVVSGPSGSGKTTLLNLIVGWESPDSGEVASTLGDSWSDLATVPQRLGLLETLTIAENIGLPGRLGHAKRSAVAISETLGIGALGDRFPSETSLGEQQRAAIARALVASPRLLIADEPTSHQDDVSVQRIIDELVGAAEAGSAVLVATHDQRVVGRATTVFTMTDGVLAEVATSH